MSHKKTYLYNFNLYEMFRIDKYIKTGCLGRNGE